jgi:hypothetical protein
MQQKQEKLDIGRQGPIRLQSQSQCLWQASSPCGRRAVQPFTSSRGKAFQEAWSFVNCRRHEEETARRQQQLSSRTEECIRLRQLGSKGYVLGPHVTEQRFSEGSQSSGSMGHADLQMSRGEEKMAVDKPDDPELPGWAVLCAIDEHVEIDDEFGLRPTTPREDAKALDTMMPGATAEVGHKPVRMSSAPVILQGPSPSRQSTSAWPPGPFAQPSIDSSTLPTHRTAAVPHPAIFGRPANAPGARGRSVAAPVVQRSSSIRPSVVAISQSESMQHGCATKPLSALSTVQPRVCSTMSGPLCSASPPGQPQHGTMLQLHRWFRENRAL